jgi:hypothetical protein
MKLVADQNRKALARANSAPLDPLDRPHRLMQTASESPWSPASPTKHFIAHAMISFLDQVAKEYPHEHIFMVMDGVGWHRAAELKIPRHKTIVHLPPYSPELNPAGHLWDELREKHFANRVFDDLDAVFQHLITAVRLLHDEPQRIASLTGFDWIIRGG